MPAQTLAQLFGVVVVQTGHTFFEFQFIVSHLCCFCCFGVFLFLFSITFCQKKEGSQLQLPLVVKRLVAYNSNNICSFHNGGFCCYFLWLCLCVCRHLILFVVKQFRGYLYRSNILLYLYMYVYFFLIVHSFLSNSISMQYLF